MTIDMGAHEFDNVELKVTGEATPGGTLTVLTTGTPGLAVFLGIGRPPGASFLPPWGTVFFDLSRPARILGFGTIPSVRNMSIPPTVSVPADFVMQHLAFVASSGLAMPPGNLSNPVFLTIE